MFNKQNKYNFSTNFEFFDDRYSELNDLLTSALKERGVNNILSTSTIILVLETGNIFDVLPQSKSFNYFSWLFITTPFADSRPDFQDHMIKTKFNNFKEIKFNSRLYVLTTSSNDSKVFEVYKKLEDLKISLLASFNPVSNNNFIERSYIWCIFQHSYMYRKARPFFNM